eukprot:CAMPEP_0115164320 /NCGR_PEP_ID=MMETSP0227-20121206/72976_1 /TAXON_ID=89957 /ORGANISM="Polarella glacialis, Strain CCMP 1383" /LENGTH=82 /DNA_ID=CAMNT_0002576677 /DNA_START=608 /DNA_END=856 /DNA_ORIENTATION=-
MRGASNSPVTPPARRASAMWASTGVREKAWRTSLGQATTSAKRRISKITHASSRTASEPVGVPEELVASVVPSHGDRAASTA